MTQDQQHRLVKLSFVGSICAVLTAWGMNALLFLNTTLSGINFETMSPFYISAGLATFIAIQFVWRIMLLRKPETRKRGSIYGFICGFLCIFLMSLIYTIGAILGVFSNEEVSSNIGVALFSPFFFTGIFLLFGGFVAPLFGAFLGYKFARNPK